MKGLLNAFEVVEMGIKAPTIDEDIVEKNKDELTDERPEKIIHFCLEGRGGITEPKQHNIVLVVAVVSTESSFVYVCWCHSNLMKSLCEVHSRDPGGVMEVVQELVDGGNWESIFNSDGVECTIHPSS